MNNSRQQWENAKSYINELNSSLGESLTNLCLDQLKTVQENHGESISNIRSEAEKCLVKDYLVGWLAQNVHIVQRI